MSNIMSIFFISFKTRADLGNPVYELEEMIWVNFKKLKNQKSK